MRQFRKSNFPSLFTLFSENCRLLSKSIFLLVSSNSLANVSPPTHLFFQQLYSALLPSFSKRCKLMHWIAYAIFSHLECKTCISYFFLQTHPVWIQRWLVFENAQNLKIFLTVSNDCTFSLWIWSPNIRELLGVFLFNICVTIFSNGGGGNYVFKCALKSRDKTLIQFAGARTYWSIPKMDV